MPSETGIVHVIDDDEALRDSLTFLLRAAGFEVKSHRRRRPFSTRCRRLVVSCIVSDVRCRA